MSHDPFLNRRVFVRNTLLASLPIVLPGSTRIAQGAQRKAADIKRPNIIFIMADDLGYGHLGCYGQTKIRTPNIDRMADEGTRFSQCYAGAPVCAPSRSVLMTGLHCGHTSVRANSGGVPILPDDLTVAEVLSKQGYTTGIFGKWGLGDFNTPGIPTKQGFDEFFGYLHQVHAHFYYPYFLWKNEEKYLLPGNEGGKRKQYTHDLIVREAMNFIREHKDNPFFLYIPFTIPHTELLVPEDSFKEYEGEFPEPNPYTGDHYADQPAPRTAFAAMVSRMDRDVGRIMRLLRELSIEEDTIVFFTSDNGGQGSGGPDLEFFKGNGPLRGAKGDLYEGGIRVPMIARWPGIIPAGGVSDHVWAFDDVFPTLAELAGVQAPESIDGVSALPSILGQQLTGHPQEKREFHYWEHRGGRAARMGDWKAILPRDNKPLELYNLRNDISETTNVAADYPKIVSSMKSILEKAHVPPREYENEPPTWRYKPEKTGYVR